MYKFMGSKKWWCVHVWKPQCFDWYQTMVSAQLRRDVSASIQELDRVVLKITVSVEKKVVWNLYVASRGTTSSFRIYCIKGGIIRTKPIHHSCQKWFGNCYLHAGAKNATIAYPNFTTYIQTCERWRRFVLNHSAPCKENVTEKITYRVCAFPVRYFSLWERSAGSQMRPPFPFHDATSYRGKIATLVRQNAYE